MLKIAFLNLDFEAASTDTALHWIAQKANADEFTFVVTPNVDHILQLREFDNADVVEAYALADLTICDSRVLSLLARISGLRLPALPGSDLTRELLQTSAIGTRFAVIGGDAELMAALSRKFPHFNWVAHHPPMGVRSNTAARTAIADFVASSGAQIFLFAIGAPQSEITCAEIKRSGRSRGTALCIGASLQFLTGHKTRAPKWVQNAKLEWLFRLLSEPKRLWKRYLVVGPRIIPVWWNWHCLKEARSLAESDSSLSDASKHNSDRSEFSKEHRKERASGF